MILVIGKGPWGQNIARTLGELGVPYEVAKRDWRDKLKTAKKVIIATPPSTHYWLVRAALREGLPCLVEKPMCLDLGDAEHLIQLSLQSRNKAEVPLMVGHVLLHNENFQRLVDRTQLDPAETAVITDGGPGPQRSNVSGLWDWGPHAAALLLKLAGPLHIFQIKARGNHDNYHVSGTINDLQFSWLGGSQLQAKTRKLRVFTQHGKVLDFDAAEPVITPPLEVELVKFVSGQFENEVIFGSHVVRLLEAVDESLRRRQSSHPIRGEVHG